MRLEPAQSKVLRIVEPRTPGAATRPAFTSSDTSLRVNGLCLDLGGEGFIELPGAGRFSLPRLVTTDDWSDTWSHGMDQFGKENPETAIWAAAVREDHGPLMESIFQSGTLGRGEVRAEWRLYQGKPWIECHLRVLWTEKRRVLKLEWEMPGAIVRRTDGIMGGRLDRPVTGRELPLRDWTRVALDGSPAGMSVAIIAPEVYSLDQTQRRINLTLLRSAVLACHAPNEGEHPRRIFSDQGEHCFRFRFLAGNLETEYLDDIATAWQRPLLTCEMTRGMRTRAQKGAYAPPVF